MRPSLTTLAGMTLAAGSIAMVGAGLVGGSTASANSQPVHASPIMQVDIAPLDLGPMVKVAFTQTAIQPVAQPQALEPIEIGTDAEVDFVNEPGDDYSWLDGDSCPPCGMG